MTCWRANFCPLCNKRLIHLSGRNGEESSSPFGQLLHREFAHGKYGLGDIDQYLHQNGKWQLSGGMLLRLLEHKQAQSGLDYAQRVTLETLGMLIDHALECPNRPFRLDPQSGVYVLRGSVIDESNGHHKTVLDGPQTIERLGSRYSKQVIESHAELFDWLLPGQTQAAIDAMRWPS